jgi:hypothetical protein
VPFLAIPSLPNLPPTVWRALVAPLGRAINARGTELANQKAALDVLRDVDRLITDINIKERTGIFTQAEAEMLRREAMRRGDVSIVADGPANAVCRADVLESALDQPVWPETLPAYQTHDSRQL